MEEEGRKRTCGVEIVASRHSRIGDSGGGHQESGTRDQPSPLKTRTMTFATRHRDMERNETGELGMEDEDRGRGKGGMLKSGPKK